MQYLGISIYPEKTSLEENMEYIKLAHKYGYNRIFTSLLEITGSQEVVMDKFSNIIKYGNDLGFKTVIDINPSLFKQLEINYDNLSLFAELGVWGIRLDTGFSGMEEALMTRNKFGLKIEINVSSGTGYLDNIMKFNPNTDNLLGCHNFYPQKLTGLGQDFFIEQSKRYKEYGLHTAAFVSSKKAKNGPWPVQDGLPTMEQDRNLPIRTQVNHIKLTRYIDDVIIGNAFASEEELKEMSEAFYSEQPQLTIETLENLNVDDRKVLFDNVHLYRGDKSDYLLRNSTTRVKYKNTKFETKNNNGLVNRGDILIVNKSYGQYNGELQIALKQFENDGRRSVVGKIKDTDLSLLSLIEPWSTFVLVEI
ncbi:DUF871 domain-containing protein [Liquorilactobacillus mali]|uniref:DUF871 domain-containing protein n=1 Tax=Liquorilactobacillus mali TaxID=1618 RepID=UPI00235099DB|nr:MupG family TIM beta-alpha barrel fold protein [Liquorilactobacillus mali]MDC7952250.1 DUF871 domain-containing protein [Liquorilactobacillus mali]MDN7145126.1 MupG family TIM beta-alpha barrel fold protein [Liquorilactobacillus mali]